MAEALVRIGEVLRSENEFCDDLKAPPVEILAEFKRARTTADLAAVATRLA